MSDIYFLNLDTNLSSLIYIVFAIHILGYKIFHLYLDLFKSILFSIL